MKGWSGRIPDQILNDFEAAVRNRDESAAYDALHEILADIHDTAERDLRWRFQRGEDVAEVDEHLNSVRQYIVNFYGED